MPIIFSDDRANTLFNWLTTEVKLTITHFEPASSDASFRRYFRVFCAQKTYIAMDAPPEKENIAAFLHVAKQFQLAGVNVPDIIHSSVSQGFILLEDFGPRCLLEVLSPENMPTLYKKALEYLYLLQSNITLLEEGKLPHYTPVLLHAEINLFSDWFLKKKCQLTLSKTTVSLLNQCAELLVNSALAQTQVCIHRDYHSRNLMYIDDNHLGVIDFQDAVIGPISYDIVSLLKDCYINWSDTQITHCLTPYYQQLITATLIDCDFNQFQRDFDLMGMQRHLKAIGIFSRLSLRDGKQDYLNDIPRTLKYLIQTSKKYPEFQDLYHFLTHTVIKKL